MDASSNAPTAVSAAATTATVEPSSKPNPSVTSESAVSSPTPLSETSRLEEEDTFYAGALKRTGTLYEGAKEGMLKRSGTVTEAVSGGLKRTGTLLGGAKEGLVTRSASIRDAAAPALQRTGTVLEDYRQGMLKRTGTISENARAGLSRTGTILAGARDGAVARASSFSEWATDYAKGIYDPERPMKATFMEVAGVALCRSGHTIAIVDGRAYIFGGEDETGALADNHMHVVILPSSGVLEADYKSIAPRAQQKDGETPAARKGHICVTIEDDLYIIGGQLSDKAKEEPAGRVWIFDTISSRWSYADPRADAPYPPPRHSHAAVASNEPGRSESAVDTSDLQRQYLNPSITVPEPESTSSYGTIFIYGGVSPSDSDQLLNDAWAFDVATRTWLPLPPPPAPVRASASIVLAGDNNAHLYRIGGRTDPEHVLEADYLDVTELLKSRTESVSKLSLPTLLSEWESVPLSAPLLGSQIRRVDPGDGRHMLLSIQAGARSVTTVDVSPSGGMMLLAGTAEIGEGEEMKAPRAVQAVQVQYADVYGEVVRGPMTGRHLFTQTGGFAVAPGTSVEEAGLVVWGGRNAEGRVVGSGWMVRFEQ